MTIFVSGRFDILHRGHLSLLQYCHDYKRIQERRMKDLSKVVVGLNSDASIKKTKGKGRPITKEADRKYFLISLEYVDEVHIFDERTPRELIEKIKPDLIVKTSLNPEETEGFDVKIYPKIKGYSTTNFVNDIRVIQTNN
jgi:rfaE bifunctional protein nucleotidyltransferase chain/domain|tara:strand:- start:587 stop:1006 length:420 start_codon:yes stop_codon:yes gene_type:complete